MGALFLAWWSRKPFPEEQRLVVRGLVFSTVYQVSVVSDKFSKNAEETIQSLIQRESEFVDNLMSRYRESSELNRLNRHRSTRPFPLSLPLADLLNKAMEISRSTGGAFDITVGPLIKLWGFDQKKDRTSFPSEEEIAAVLKRVDYKNLILNTKEGSVTKKIPDVDADLSAIAKGYAVDKIALALNKIGFSNYLVEIGGEVRGKGTSEKGSAWRIGVEKPISERRETFQVIELNNSSVATSGDYRNFYILNGRRVSHTLDPRNGRPVSHGLASVTVVHNQCAIADALATGLTVLGPEKGYELAEKLKLPALFITRMEDESLVDRATGQFRALSVSRKNTTRNGGR